MLSVDHTAPPPTLVHRGGDRLCNVTLKGVCGTVAGNAPGKGWEFGELHSLHACTFPQNRIFVYMFGMDNSDVGGKS